MVEICQREGAVDYLNAEGGRALYTPAGFAQAGVRLHFLTHHPRAYPQRGSAFLERLSIIDVMMCNPATEWPRLLGDCAITAAEVSAASTN